MDTELILIILFVLFVAMCLLLRSMQPRGKRGDKPRQKQIFVLEVTEQQRHISAVWAAQRGVSTVFLELKSIGQIVEGACVRDNSVLIMSNGTYFPPALSFTLTREDGAEVRFSGRVTADGASLKGRFSDFHHFEELNFMRLPLSRAQSPSSYLETPEREGFAGVDYSIADSSLAPLLVYVALDAVLKVSIRMVPDYGLESIASLIDASQLSAPMLLNPELPSQPVPVLMDRESASVPTLAPGSSPNSAHDHTVTLAHGSAPEPVPVPMPVLTPAATAIKRCPKCDVEWTEAFSFCLHCGYTP